MAGLINFFGSWNLASPLFFWLAGALCLLLIFIPWSRRRRGLALELEPLRNRVRLENKRVWMVAPLAVLCVLLIAGALSGPRMTEETTTHVYGYPVMLVVDVSGSMGAGTNEPSGYEQSLEVFNNLVSLRGNINFGLIIFSAEDYVARYFVNKNELFLDTLQNKADIIDIANGTRPTDALEKSRQFLTQYIEGGGKAIIFISDLNVAGQEATDLAQEITRISLSGINLYILATGEKDLRTAQIPQVPGVQVIDMNDKAGIDQMLQEIYSMQMPVIREEKSQTEKNLVPFLVLPALAVLTLCLVLSETRFRKIP